jgi:hypothetical protein
VYFHPKLSIMFGTPKKAGWSASLLESYALRVD